MEWVDAVELKKLVSAATLYRKLRSGEWIGRGRPKQVLVASLPEHLRASVEAGTREKPECRLSRIPSDEREAWIAESMRLANIVERYDQTKPKRLRAGGLPPAVLALCEEARCADDRILAREPRRAAAPSPRTLERWLRAYRERGTAAFLPAIATRERAPRRAVISPEAVAWVNAHWRRYRSPRALHRALIARSRDEGWSIPSERWTYRRWREMPAPVSTYHLFGRRVYTSKYAPYVPRHVEDLDALQVVCGDHSERDVTVVMPDGALARPWLTVWQDMRTALIWGWHLDVTPSSRTAGLAYCNGVLDFGAQPLSRPDDDYYSYVYTDQGKDYKSRTWDGRVISVHRQACKLDGGLEMLRVETHVGFLDELGIKHLLARGYNAREKPVERFFRDLSDWEESLDGFCGRTPSGRPDRWRAMYARHRKSPDESPFQPMTAYREALRLRICEYNNALHERAQLGGARIVPIAEFNRLYTTRYDISRESLALLLMKSERRLIRKNGVMCFRPNWFYLHPAMQRFKGRSVEVRYSDEDYGRVWVILPDGEICEASLITPTSIINPNRDTLRAVAQATSRERQLIRDYNLLAESGLRGESTEDRVAAALDPAEERPVAVGESRASVHRMTRMDRPKLHAVSTRPISAEDVEFDESIFRDDHPAAINEWDFDDEA